jgi:dynein heavy chain
MKQEVTRRHKSEKWALDDVVYHNEVTNFQESSNVKSGPPEGVYIHGLFLEACAWSRQEGSLVESEPKKLFTQLPVLFVSAQTKELEIKAKRETYGATGPYECPCYKYFARGDRYLIFMVNLKSNTKLPVHWVLRGAALLCSTD